MAIYTLGERRSAQKVSIERLTLPAAIALLYAACESRAADDGACKAAARRLAAA